MAKDPFDEMKSPLIDKPEYLQAIGLVTVEINMMEFLLAAILGVMIKVSPEIGRAIYYAPKAASARTDILVHAARAAITDNPRLLASIESLERRAKGVFNDRHGVAHDRWMVPLGATTVHRGSGASLDQRSAQLAELEAIVKRARSLWTLPDFAGPSDDRSSRSGRLAHHLRGCAKDVDQGRRPRA